MAVDDDDAEKWPPGCGLRVSDGRQHRPAMHGIDARLRQLRCELDVRNSLAISRDGYQDLPRALNQLDVRLKIDGLSLTLSVYRLYDQRWIGFVTHL